MDIDAHRAALDAWLILLRAPGIGAATLRTLIAQHGGIEQALDALRRDTGTLGAACRDWLRAPDERLLAMDRAWLAQSGHTLLTFGAEDFPALLNEIPSPPAALFVAGEVSALWRPQIAIVGSRSASQAGAANASAFARALVRAGFAIISGLAEGIDAAAHVAALDAGGLTVAVFGTGPDLVYPVKHRELAARIAQQGALVSEFSPGTPGRSMHFPRRNRIIAGLALGTLVVEASLRSGSLITAREASESGREVFALPGSIHNPLARGCHQLIRNGAKLVETADEIVAELAPLARRLGASLRERLQETPAANVESVTDPSRSAHADDPDYARLLAALGHDALGIDELSARTSIPVAALSSMLLMLELEGEVVPAQGGYARQIGGSPKA